MSLREELLAVEDLAHRPIKVWGKDLFVRPMSMDEQLAFDMQTIEINRKNPTWTQEDKSRSHIGRLVVRSLVDADGVQVFRDADADAVSKKSAGPVGRIYNLAQEVSALSEGVVEEMVKNSEASPA